MQFLSDILLIYILCIIGAMLIFIFYSAIMFLVLKKKNWKPKDPKNKIFVILLIFLGCSTLIFDTVYDTFDKYTIVFIIISLLSVVYLYYKDIAYINKTLDIINKIYSNEEKVFHIKQSWWHKFKAKLGLAKKDFNTCEQLRKENAILRKSLPQKGPLHKFSFIVLSIIFVNVYICYGLFLYKLYMLNFLHLDQIWQLFFVPHINVLAFVLASFFIRLVFKQITQRFSFVFSESVLKLTNSRFNFEEFKNFVFTYDWFKFRVISSITIFGLTYLLVTYNFYIADNTVHSYMCEILIPFLAILVAYCVTIRTYDMSSLWFISIQIFLTLLLSRIMLDYVFLPLSVSMCFISSPKCQHTSYTDSRKHAHDLLMILSNKLHKPNFNSNEIKIWFENLSHRIRKISQTPELDNLTYNCRLKWSPLQAFVKLLNLKANYKYIPAWAWTSAENRFNFILCSDVKFKLFRFDIEGNVKLFIQNIRIFPDNTFVLINKSVGYSTELSQGTYVFYTEYPWSTTSSPMRKSYESALSCVKPYHMYLPNINNNTFFNMFTNFLKYNNKFNPYQNGINYYNLGIYKNVLPNYLPFKTTLSDANFLVTNLLYINRLLIKEIYPRVTLLFSNPYSFNGGNAVWLNTAFRFCDTYDDYMSCLYHHYPSLFVKFFNMARPQLVINHIIDWNAIIWNDLTYHTLLVDYIGRYVIFEDTIDPHPTLVCARYNRRFIDRSVNAFTILTRSYYMPYLGWNEFTVNEFFGLNIGWNFDIMKYEEEHAMPLILHGYEKLSHFEEAYEPYFNTEFFLNTKFEDIIRGLERLDRLNNKNSNPVNIYLNTRKTFQI